MRILNKPRRWWRPWESPPSFKKVLKLAKKLEKKMDSSPALAPEEQASEVDTGGHSRPGMK